LKELTGQVAIQEANAFTDIFRVANGWGVVVERLKIEFEEVSFVGWW
jgi:hypothetical protein